MLRKLKEWFNGPSRPLVPPPTGPGVTYPVYDGDLPVTIPLANTAFEDVIDDIFLRAQQEAEGLAVGTEFTITAMYPSGQHPMVIIGPLMMRAADHGLACNYVMNEQISFTKL